MCFGCQSNFLNSLIIKNIVSQTFPSAPAPVPAAEADCDILHHNACDCTSYKFWKWPWRGSPVFLQKYAICFWQICLKCFEIPECWAIKHKAVENSFLRLSTIILNSALLLSAWALMHSYCITQLLEAHLVWTQIISVIFLLWRRSQRNK